MILLVFEGTDSEPHLMATLRELFFPGEKEYVLCSFGTDTYTLWKEVNEHSAEGFDADTFTILKQYLQRKGDHTLDGYYSYQVEAIYLFFDYDPQNRMPAEMLNRAISQMCSTFDDEMDRGKIYISYPMFESLFCEDTIPEDAYLDLSIPVALCNGFKGWAHDNFYYGSHPLALSFRTSKQYEITEIITEDRRNELFTRWKELVEMNVRKAIHICNNKNELSSSEVSISQQNIFQHELDDYVSPLGEVAVLNSFPLFLFDFFRKS